MKKKEIFEIWNRVWLENSDIEYIINKVTGTSKSQLFFKIIFKEKETEKILNIFRKIEFGYPIEYALNNAEFYWLDFYVDERCLIPRNETEIMVEKALEEINSIEIKNFLSLDIIDIWTGSSGIICSICKNYDKKANFFAIDISEKALEIAKINIKKHNLEDKITLLQGSLLEPFIDKFEKNYSKIDEEKIIITANLPYIKDNDFSNMDKKVVLHEPAVALYWGKETWFELYEKLIEQILDLKNKILAEIILFIEIWFDQKEYAKKYLKNKNLEFEIFKDMIWVERCIKISF